MRRHSRRRGGGGLFELSACLSVGLQPGVPGVAGGYVPVLPRHDRIPSPPPRSPIHGARRQRARDVKKATDDAEALLRRKHSYLTSADDDGSLASTVDSLTTSIDAATTAPSTTDADGDGVDDSVVGFVGGGGGLSAAVSSQSAPPPPVRRRRRPSR